MEINLTYTLYHSRKTKSINTWIKLNSWVRQDSEVRAVLILFFGKSKVIFSPLPKVLANVTFIVKSFSCVNFMAVANWKTFLERSLFLNVISNSHLSFCFKNCYKFESFTAVHKLLILLNPIAQYRFKPFRLAWVYACFLTNDVGNF